MNKPLVSIIIPTYNRATFIEETLDSVWNQTYRPIEVLIVDDGSTDQTKQVVDEWEKKHIYKDFQVLYFYQKNTGAPTARNTGMKNATGRFLQFLDSDDFLMPEKLDLQINLMLEEKTGICVCDYHHVDMDENIIRLASNDRSIEQIITEHRFLGTAIGVMDTTFFKPGSIKWNPKIKKAQDIDFYLKIFLVIDRFSYINKALYKWRRHNVETITSIQYSSEIYWVNLISLLKYHLKNRHSIQAYKKPFIRRWYLKMLKALYFSSSISKYTRFPLDIWRAIR